jgi:membrane protein YdbS with pleckstrin-like domain
MDYIYGIYTTVFGVMTLLFALGFWIQKDFGWIGTFATLLFVAVADALTLLNLPSVPGIPKFAAVAEIAYSVIVLLYLVQPHVRVKAVRTNSSQSAHDVSREKGK